MVFWRIEYGPEKLLGWQVMDETLSNAKLYDDNGNELTGGFDYTVISTDAVLPSWWVG